MHCAKCYNRHANVLTMYTVLIQHNSTLAGAYQQEVQVFDYKLYWTQSNFNPVLATRRHVKKEVLTLQPEGGINVGTKFNISPSLMCQYISVSTAKCERWWH